VGSLFGITPTHDGDEIHESTENELVRFFVVEVKVTKQELLHEIPINHPFMVVHHFLHGTSEILVRAGGMRQDSDAIIGKRVIRTLLLVRTGRRNVVEG